MLFKDSGKKVDMKTMKRMTAVPTGFHFLDIMFGENVRDTKGQLLTADRGPEIGKISMISAVPGGGKSTLIAPLGSHGYNLNFPLIKVVVLNTDAANWKTSRISKTTGLRPDIVEKLFDVRDVSFVEDLDNIMHELNKEYLKAQHQPVVVTDPITGEDKYMMPYYVIILDTISSVSTNTMGYSDDAKAESKKGDNAAIRNDFSQTVYLKLGNFINNIPNAFMKNFLFFACVHLDDNYAARGQSVAAKQYKSDTNSKKDKMPKMLHKKMSTGFRIFELADSSNTDSTEHPINKYGLFEAKDSKSCFVGKLKSVKSRTGSEGRTVVSMPFINGSFDRTAHLILTSMSLDILKQSTAKYPSAAEPTIFAQEKEGAEYKHIKTKGALSLEGYPYNTNVIEARLLLDYCGDNEAILRRQEEFYIALFAAIEHKMYYELESNNMLEEEFSASDKKMNIYKKFMSNISVSKFEKVEKLELPPKINEDDYKMKEDADDIEEDDDL